MIINGVEKGMDGLTIAEVLSQLGLDADKVVVEVNFEIVAKESYQEWILNKEDKVEIVSFVGGG